MTAVAQRPAPGGFALRSGTTAAIIAGPLFGALYMIVFGVTLALFSGAPARPAVGAAALAGLAGALVLIFVNAGRSAAVRRAGVAAAIFAVLVVASLGAPFGLAAGTATLWQIVGIVVLVAVTTQTLWMCLSDAPAGAVRRYDFEIFVIRILKGVGYVVFTVFVVLPFYVMVMTSFKSQAELLANPLDFSIDITGAGLLDSYTELFSKFNFGTYILNSAIVSVSTVLITLFFAVPGAYTIARLRFRGRTAFANSVLLIYMVPAIVLVLPLYTVFSQLGLRNSLLGLLIVYPATTIPVALYMLQGYFRGLPAEMEEAGLMDGLTRLGVIAKITLPLSLPALTSVALYVFMIAWNEFLFAFMFLDDPAIFTLPRGVVSLNSSELPRELLMAGAVTATVPIMVIFLWLERFMVRGLAAGAVKG
ncbi:ABC transporter permease [Acuticoccus sediminis]|uniref:ABC transporter permease n=1 Tax=Acuticoccus sediminis TaxID=2184697 RepID=A0A8B2NK60_9HYPH|nr:carbohydrate ABC transporter permease [Acuticoccus sediminis]RAH99875.1 ABC transporter permease [Acuticoccus sediminis]